MTDDAPTISQAVESTPQSTEQNISYLDTLVGEGKKYSEGEQLARGYVNADNHIKILEEEQKELRAQNKALESLLNRFKDDDEEEEPAHPAQPTNDSANSNSIDITQVESTVQSFLERERELERRRTVQDDSYLKLDSEFGSRDAGMSVVKDILEKNPSLKSTIDDLGQTDSDAFIRLIRSYKDTSAPGSNAPGLSEQPSASAVRGSDGDFLPWSEAQRIRKENPDVYKTEEFRKRMEASNLKAEREGRDYFAT